MYIIWLIVMGIFVGFLALPVMQYMGRDYGRFGRTGDVAVVVVSTLFFGLLLGTLLGLVGFFSTGDTDAILGGFIGAGVAVVLLMIFSAAKGSVESS